MKKLSILLLLISTAQIIGSLAPLPVKPSLPKPPTLTLMDAYRTAIKTLQHYEYKGKTIPSDRIIRFAQQIKADMLQIPESRKHLIIRNTLNRYKKELGIEAGRKIIESTQKIHFLRAYQEGVHVLLKFRHQGNPIPPEKIQTMAQEIKTKLMEIPRTDIVGYVRKAKVSFQQKPV